MTIKDLRNIHLVSVLTLLVSTGLACTHALIAPSGSKSTSHYSTLGVAQITHCMGGPAQVVFKEDGTKTDQSTEDQTNLVVLDQSNVTMTCDSVVHLESSGFTGWDSLDAVITGFIGWMTFGAVSF